MEIEKNGFLFLNKNKDMDHSMIKKSWYILNNVSIIEKNKDEYNNLKVNANIWYNHTYMGCKYPTKVMNRLKNK
jgi:hypothetical protein